MLKITHFGRKFWFKDLGSQKPKYFLHRWFMISPQPRPYFTIACRYVTGDGDGHTDYLESSIF